MVIGSLVFAGVMFTIGLFLWFRNGIKRKDSNIDFTNDL